MFRLHTKNHKHWLIAGDFETRNQAQQVAAVLIRHNPRLSFHIENMQEIVWL